MENNLSIHPDEAMRIYKDQLNKGMGGIYKILAELYTMMDQEYPEKKKEV